jgi:uncharacterized membrane protein YozB (DUF420 family)
VWAFPGILEIALATIAGAFSGYFTPWFAWQIEKRRELRTHRREMVEKWRTDLLDLETYRLKSTNGESIATAFSCGQGPSSQTFASMLIRHQSFASLRTHLTANFIEKLTKINNERAIILEMGGPPSLYTELCNEISELEKSWKLI